MNENTVSIDKAQEDQGQHKEVCVISPKNSTTIDLTATSESDPMSVDNTDFELVSTVSSIKTSQPSSKLTTATSYYSRIYSKTASTSALSPSAALPDALTSFFKIHN